MASTATEDVEGADARAKMEYVLDLVLQYWMPNGSSSAREKMKPVEADLLSFLKDLLKLNSTDKTESCFGDAVGNFPMTPLQFYHFIDFIYNVVTEGAQDQNDILAGFLRVYSSHGKVELAFVCEVLIARELRYAGRLSDALEMMTQLGNRADHFQNDSDGVFMKALFHHVDGRILLEQTGRHHDNDGWDQLKRACDAMSSGKGDQDVMLSRHFSSMLYKDKLMKEGKKVPMKNRTNRKNMSIQSFEALNSTWKSQIESVEEVFGKHDYVGAFLKDYADFLWEVGKCHQEAINVFEKAFEMLKPHTSTMASALLLKNWGFCSVEIGDLNGIEKADLALSITRGKNDKNTCRILNRKAQFFYSMYMKCSLESLELATDNNIADEGTLREHFNNLLGPFIVENHKSIPSENLCDIRYKRKLCTQESPCRYGLKCTFAHGEEELRK